MQKYKKQKKSEFYIVKIIPPYGGFFYCMIKEAFKDPALSIVTGKNIKGRVYTDAGYQLSCDEQLRRAVQKGEDAYDRRLGTDIFAPVYPDGKGYGFPYETDVALNKALYLIKALEEQKESITPFEPMIWLIKDFSPLSLKEIKKKKMGEVLKEFLK